MIAFFSEPVSDFPPDAAGLLFAFFGPTDPDPAFIAFGPASLSDSFSSSSSLTNPSWLSTSICVLGVFCSGEDQGQGFGEVTKRDVGLQ